MWVDPCYNILTTAARQAFSHQQASYGKIAAWVRKYFKAHSFSRKGSIDEQEARLKSLLSECATHIDGNCEVEALCRSFPKRLQELVDNLGDSLKR